MLHILICDDSQACRRRLVRMLAEEGIETDEACDGQEALEQVSGSPEGYYGAVILDISMPVMDGLEAARRIKCLGRIDVQGMPLIAASGNSRGVYQPLAAAAGMAAYLCKPVDKSQLTAVLRRLLKSVHN